MFLAYHMPENRRRTVMLAFGEDARKQRVWTADEFVKTAWTRMVQAEESCTPCNHSIKGLVTDAPVDVVQ